MDMMKMIIDANMQALYVLKPEGELKVRVDQLKERLAAYGAANPGAVDIVGESGLRDEYNKLYMDIISKDGLTQEKIMARIGDIRDQYDDKAVRDKINAEMSAILDALVFGWTDACEKIRAGHEKMVEYAQAMVVTRKQTRKFCYFLYEDMGMNLDDLESLWFEDKPYVKQVLLGEILASKTIEDILLIK